MARGRTLRPPRWGLPDIAIVLVGSIVLSVVGVVIGIALDLPAGWMLLVGVTTPWIAMAGWPLLITTLRGNGPRIDLGLRFTWLDVGWGLLGGFAALMGSMIAAVIMTAIVGDFTSAAGDVAADIRNEGPFIALVLFALCVAFGAPIVEELAFRGLIFSAIVKKGLHPAWAIAITTIAFAAFHLEPSRMPILLISGLVFGVLRWYTRGLGAPIVAHAVVNIPGAAFLLIDPALLPAT